MRLQWAKKKTLPGFSLMALIFFSPYFFISYLLNLLGWHWLTKLIQVSGAQSHKTSSGHCIVCSHQVSFHNHLSPPPLPPIPSSTSLESLWGPESCAEILFDFPASLVLSALGILLKVQIWIPSFWRWKHPQISDKWPGGAADASEPTPLWVARGPIRIHFTHPLSSNFQHQIPCNLIFCFAWRRQATTRFFLLFYHHSVRHPALDP